MGDVSFITALSLLDHYLAVILSLVAHDMKTCFKLRKGESVRNEDLRTDPAFGNPVQHIMPVIRASCFVGRLPERRIPDTDEGKLLPEYLPICIS